MESHRAHLLGNCLPDRSVSDDCSECASDQLLSVVYVIEPDPTHAHGHARLLGLVNVRSDVITSRLCMTSRSHRSASMFNCFKPAGSFDLHVLRITFDSSAAIIATSAVKISLSVENETETEISIVRKRNSSVRDCCYLLLPETETLLIRKYQRETITFKTREHGCRSLSHAVSGARASGSRLWYECQ